MTKEEIDSISENLHTVVDSNNFLIILRNIFSFGDERFIYEHVKDMIYSTPLPYTLLSLSDEDSISILTKYMKGSIILIKGKDFVAHLKNNDINTSKNLSRIYETCNNYSKSLILLYSDDWKNHSDQEYFDKLKYKVYNTPLSAIIETVIDELCSKF